MVDIILITDATTGAPTKIIHGTSEMVSRKVRRYKGMVANCSPNSQ